MMHFLIAVKTISATAEYYNNVPSNLPLSDYSEQFHKLESRKETQWELI